MTNLQHGNTPLNNDTEVENVRTNASGPQAGTDSDKSVWIDHVAMIQAAHIVLLERENVIDQAAANAMLRAVDAVHVSNPPEKGSIWQTVAGIEDRVDAALPVDIAGAASLGRTRSETIAAALRMEWRVRVASMATRSLGLREVLVELANAHAVTVMGAFADRKAAAPTTLAHFLGGVIGPLESTWSRLLAAIDSLDRSPMGAGLLVGEVFGTNRNESAKLLGFRESIHNTIDASGSVEDVVEALEAISAQAAVIQRFVHELLIWIRTDPTSFFIDERWESVPEPAHPAHAVSIRLEQINYRARHVGVYAHGAVELVRSQPYGPVSVVWDQIAQNVHGVFDLAETLLEDTSAAVREALIVNRAYLANRAGRLYSTATDLAAFLMEDQQLSPANAQRIAGLSIARLKDASLEAAQITPDIIDGAAVMVIGQELKVEMETLGRYIAPRRYIERRDVLGSPKADRTKAWLIGVTSKIQQDSSEIKTRRDRWNVATAELSARLAESAESKEN